MISPTDGQELAEDRAEIVSKTGLKPWYFADGTPMRPDIIRRLVRHAGVISKPTEEPKAVSRKLVLAIAKYVARKVQGEVEQVLFEALTTTAKRRYSLSGDPKSVARRAWRRVYQRRYRAKQRSQVKMAI